MGIYSVTDIISLRKIEYQTEIFTIHQYIFYWQYYVFGHSTLSMGGSMRMLICLVSVHISTLGFVSTDDGHPLPCSSRNDCLYATPPLLKLCDSAYWRYSYRFSYSNVENGQVCSKREIIENLRRVVDTLHINHPR